MKQVVVSIEPPLIVGQQPRMNIRATDMLGAQECVIVLSQALTYIAMNPQQFEPQPAPLDMRGPAGAA